MRSSIKMPRVADTSDEVVVESWSIGVGDSIGVGQALMLVETDKALVEVPSPIAGTVIELLVGESQEITTGTPIVVVEG